MADRVYVIANRKASRYRKDRELIDRVADACRSKAELCATSSFAELDETAARIAATDAKLIVLTGGDGTFMAGVTALSRAFGGRPLPPISLVPAGTAATVARNFGSVGRPEVLVSRLLARSQWSATRRPTLRVIAEQQPGAPLEERVGFIFGTGLVASFFEVYYAGGARGYAGAAQIVARIFGESFVGGPLARRVLTPLPCSVTVDGTVLEPAAFSLVCASVVKNLGLHMMVTYRGGDDPERIHLIASPLGSRDLGPRLLRVLRGKRIAPAPHFDDLAREIEVAFSPRLRDGPYVLDGDMLRAVRVRVTPGPLLPIVVP